MVSKRFPVVYSVLFGFCVSIMMILMVLLFAEYRFFCTQAQEMLALKQQYALYVDLLNKKVNGDDGAHRRILMGTPIGTNVIVDWAMEE